MAHTLFAYGEFLKDSVVKRLIGRNPRRAPAKLRGFRRFRDDLLGHHNLVHDEEALVEGEVLLDVSDEELIEMDKFEAAATYRRIVVTVETAAGPVEAWVYVGRP